MAEDPTSDEVWKLPKGKQSPVMRKLPVPRVKKGPGDTIPLFDLDEQNPETPPF